MTIAKANIVPFVNNRLLENFGDDDLDDEIKATLLDLSKFNLLTADPVDIAAVSGAVSIDFPTLFKREVSIVPDDGSVKRRPMIQLSGGYKEYRQLVSHETLNRTIGQMWYAKHNKKFWIFPTLTQAFTFTVDFYQHHAADADTIAFDDEFTNAVKYGATYHAALFRKKTSYISQWLPIYVAERTSMIRMNPPQPSIVGR